jgi:hypothetical protein
MEWKKRGLIFTVEGRDPERTHAQIPTGDLIDQERLKVYYSTRDSQNRSRVESVEVSAVEPGRILATDARTVLSPGGLGTFDDCGVMPSWIVTSGETKYLYYIGWNVRNTIPYHNSIGLALGHDGGADFRRYAEGPIIERTTGEPFFSSTPCVLIDGGVWRMWYLSCVKWILYNDRPEPYYHIKYAESRDGIEWNRTGRIAVDFKEKDECAISRPCVVKDGAVYRMWYSYRSLENYRTDRNNSYRIGYAESSDGEKWTRMDEAVGISVSETGWDSEMIAYPWVYRNDTTWYMLYNGNGFGRSGFGWAVADR